MATTGNSFACVWRHATITLLTHELTRQGTENLACPTACNMPPSRLHHPMQGHPLTPAVWARCKCDHLRPLSSLTSLTSIELYRCGLSELQALATLTSLRIARLHANPDIKDVQPLSSLCKLTRLQLSQVSFTSAKARDLW